MADAHFETGERKLCGCGRPFVRHCKNEGCRWLRCSGEHCSGLYDYRRKRFWIFRKHLKAA